MCCILLDHIFLTVNPIYLQQIISKIIAEPQCNISKANLPFSKVFQMNQSTKPNTRVFLLFLVKEFLKIINKIAFPLCIRQKTILIALNFNLTFCPYIFCKGE